MELFKKYKEFFSDPRNRRFYLPLIPAGMLVIMTAFPPSGNESGASKDNISLISRSVVNPPEKPPKETVFPTEKPPKVTISLKPTSVNTVRGRFNNRDYSWETCETPGPLRNGIRNGTCSKRCLDFIEFDSSSPRPENVAVVTNSCTPLK